MLSLCGCWKEPSGALISSFIPVGTLFVPLPKQVACCRHGFDQLILPQNISYNKFWWPNIVQRKYIAWAPASRSRWCRVDNVHPFCLESLKSVNLTGKSYTAVWGPFFRGLVILRSVVYSAQTQSSRRSSVPYSVDSQKIDTDVCTLTLPSCDTCKTIFTCWRNYVVCKTWCICSFAPSSTIVTLIRERLWYNRTLLLQECYQHFPMSIVSSWAVVFAAKCDGHWTCIGNELFWAVDFKGPAMHIEKSSSCAFVSWFISSRFPFDIEFIFSWNVAPWGLPSVYAILC